MKEKIILTEEEQKSLLSMDIREEFNEISKNLDMFHAIFYQIWDMGYPRLSFDVETAAVSFDKEGKRIDFIFNPLFWKETDTYTKSFVICHEALHVIFNHGVRIKDLKRAQGNLLVANLALDVVVNHTLVDKFEFDRQSIKNSDTFCWIDTVFGKDESKVEKNRSFEYYFGLLKDKIKNSSNQSNGGSGGSGGLFYINEDGSESEVGNTLDSHDLLDSFDDENAKEAIEDQIERKLTDDEKKDFVDKASSSEEGEKRINKQDGSNPSPNSKAGNGDGSIIIKFNFKEKVKKKKKWESIIKEWTKKRLSQDSYSEQWAKSSRRMEFLPTDLMLPSELDEEHYDKEKISVWFFLDVSGSCVHLADRFFRAVRSVPEDRFLIRAFAFDTSVRELDINKPRIHAGGGTSFSIIERSIQNRISLEKITYPEAVFIITDGEGNPVDPQYPSRWHWFLSSNCTYYIPHESHHYPLSRYE